MRALIICSDRDRRQHLTHQLQALGLQTSQCAGQAKAMAALEAHGYSAVLIDAKTSEFPAYQLVQQIRDEDLDEPIIVFDLEPESPEILSCLNAGADDVAVTEMAGEELLARIQAVIRRCSPHSAGRYEIADLILEVDKHRVTRNGERIHLTDREMAILERLMLQPNRVVSRQQLAEHVWHRDLDPKANLIETYMTRLRRKIDRNHPQKLIQTVVGRGYLISPENQHPEPADTPRDLNAAGSGTDS